TKADRKEEEPAWVHVERGGRRSLGITELVKKSRALALSTEGRRLERTAMDSASAAGPGRKLSARGRSSRRTLPALLRRRAGFLHTLVRRHRRSSPLGTKGSGCPPSVNDPSPVLRPWLRLWPPCRFRYRREAAGVP